MAGGDTGQITWSLEEVQSIMKSVLGGSALFVCIIESNLPSMWRIVKLREKGKEREMRR